MAEVPFFPESEIPRAFLPAYFFGREALVEQLSGRLDQKAPSRSLVVGGPGSGRSTLCVAVAESRRASVRPLALSLRRVLPLSPHGVVGHLLALASEATGREAYRALSRRLALNPPALAAEVAREAAGLLTREPVRALLVLEDADVCDPATAALIRDLLARTKAHALVTSAREPEGDLAWLSEFKTSRLAPLPRRVCLEYAQRRLALAGIEATDEALDGLATYSQGAPQALHLLGHRLHEACLLAGRRTADADLFSAALYAALDALPAALTAPYETLPGRMREVFAALCTLPVPSVSAIGRLLGLPSGNVTVMLGRLQERGLVTRLGRGAWVPANRLVAEYVKRDHSRPTWS